MAPKGNRGKLANRKKLSLVTRRKELVKKSVKRQQAEVRHKRKENQRREHAARKAAEQLYESPALRTLLVGEGDFSFTRALVRKWEKSAAQDAQRVQDLVGYNVVATCLDDKEELVQKYPTVTDVVREIKSQGVTVHTGVDATRLLDSKRLVRSMSELFADRQANIAQHFEDSDDDVGTLDASSDANFGFDQIIFNFPHLGCGVQDKDESSKMHREMLSEFFHSAHSVLAQKGRVYVTVKTGEPYSSWRIPGIGTETGLFYVHSIVPFDPRNFDGYEHKRTLGAPENELTANIDVHSEKRSSETIIFGKLNPRKLESDEQPPSSAKGKKKRGEQVKQGKRKRTRDSNVESSEDEDDERMIKSNKLPDLK